MTLHAASAASLSRGLQRHTYHTPYTYYLPVLRLGDAAADAASLRRGLAVARQPYTHIHLPVLGVEVQPV